MNSNAKKWKQLGIDTETLLTNAVNDQGNRPFSEYELFWTRMDNHETKEFLFILLKKFKEAIQDKKKNNTEEKRLHLGAFVNTIQFICLFLPSTLPSLKSSSIMTQKVVRWLKKWKSEDGSMKLTQKFSASANIIKTLKTMQEGKDMFSSSIIGCSTLHTHEEFEMLLDIVENPTTNENLIKSGEQCFLYSYLFNSAREIDESRMAILKLTVQKFVSLPSQLRMNPKLAETTLLALLHMLKQFIAIAPVTDRDFLRRTMKTIQQFYLWPCPYGNITQDMLYLLRYELMCPGVSWVSSFRADSLGATWKINNKKNKSLFYLTTSHNPDGKRWSKIMQLYIQSQKEKERRMSESGFHIKRKKNRLPGGTQAMIILNMLNNAELLTKDDATYFAKLNDDKVNILFEQLEEMIEEMKNFQIEKEKEAQQYSLKKLTSIQEELKKMSANPKTNRPIKFDQKTEAPFMVPLPSFSHILSDCSEVKPSIEDLGTLRLMSINFRPYVLYQCMEDTLSCIFKASAEMPRPMDLRLVIAGDDQLLHLLLNQILRTYQINPRWLQGVNLKFLIIPWGENSVASFIARHDSWYHRHIYVPFRSTPPFLIPWIDQKDMERVNFLIHQKKPESTLLPPAMFYRETMEFYARQANSVCPIKVYKLEGWKPKKDNHPGSKEEPADPDELIGFCLRVEIGQVVAEIEGERETKKDAAVVFNPPDMNLKFTPMNLAGENLESINEGNISLNNLLIANIPRKKDQDQCFPPNPCSPWLEMYADPKAGAHTLSTDQRQHISELSLECNNQNQTFHALVDGQIFGPYRRIKISQALIKNSVSLMRSTSEEKKDEEKVLKEEIPFTLDIQTFFDINI